MNSTIRASDDANALSLVLHNSVKSAQIRVVGNHTKQGGNEYHREPNHRNIAKTSKWAPRHSTSQS